MAPFLTIVTMLLCAIGQSTQQEEIQDLLKESLKAIVESNQQGQEEQDYWRNSTLVQLTAQRELEVLREELQVLREGYQTIQAFISKQGKVHITFYYIEYYFISKQGKVHLTLINQFVFISYGPDTFQTPK